MKAVTDHLDKRGVEYEVVPHDPAWTGADEAAALGVPASEVAKTIVLDTGLGHVLCVIPSSRKLDKKLMRRAVGDPHARLATEDEIARDYPGYEPGALPPLSVLLGTPTYVDTELLSHEVVLFAAGTEQSSIKMAVRDLLNVEPATLTRLTRTSALAEEIC